MAGLFIALLLLMVYDALVLLVKTIVRATARAIRTASRSWDTTDFLLIVLGFMGCALVVAALLREFRNAAG
jgi:hypothetical protein